MVKVLDFGISKLDAPGEQDTTKTGQMMGSPKYMSPEQMLSMHHVDARSDIWSLGAILYEFFTGRPPFLAENTPRICALVLNADPALPSSLRAELPTELEQIVLRCLKKDPDNRFASVADLVDALAPFGPAPMVESPRSTGSRRAVVAEPPSVMAASTAGVLPSVTPTPWDAVTKIEGVAPRTPGRKRLAALMAGVALLGAIGAIYASQGGDTPVAGATVEPAASAGHPEPVAALPPTPPVPPAPIRAGDLPDVTPLSPAKPHPSAAPSGSFAKKPKPAPLPASDPFGGRRN